MKHNFMSCFLVVSGGLYRQKLKDTLPQHAGQEIRLSGFEYYQTFNLATTVADSLDNFALLILNPQKAQAQSPPGDGGDRV